MAGMIYIWSQRLATNQIRVIWSRHSFKEYSFFIYFSSWQNNLSPELKWSVTYETACQFILQITQVGRQSNREGKAFKVGKFEPYLIIRQQHFLSDYRQQVPFRILKQIYEQNSPNFTFIADHYH